jgi:hypothetical protein
LLIVVVEPVPAIDPGLIVQVPVAGNPLNITLPIGDAHEAGWVIKPTVGAGGASGAGLMITAAVARDKHPASLVTVKLYVPGIRFVIVVLVPIPAIEPGLIVHVPVAGRLLNETLPVGTAHEEGCMVEPTIGVGIGAVRVITVGADIQPAMFLAVTEYVFGARSVNMPVVFV